MQFRAGKEHPYLFFYIILFFRFITSFSAYSQSINNDHLLFSSDSLLNIEVRSDFSLLLDNREGTPEYHEGSICYTDHEGKKVQVPTRLKVRGNFRLDPEHCNFPPILVNFKKEDVPQTIFKGQDKMKLVTPCQNDKYVLKEYMIYKLYNLITDYSFKVRLLKVNYFDTITNKTYFTKYSFFLEDNKLMAERNGMKVTERFYNPYQLERKEMVILSLFEFMVGNNDWWITSHKNINLIARDSIQAPVAVPYDFDMSGFVDATYSKPEGVPEYMIADPQVYKGICLTESEKNEGFNYFNSMKENFQQEILNDPVYPKLLKNQSVNYLDRFYKIINNPGQVKTEIDNKCIKYEEYVKYKLK